jgi:hypothetical protein
MHNQTYSRLSNQLRHYKAKSGNTALDKLSNRVSKTLSMYRAELAAIANN